MLTIMYLDPISEDYYLLLESQENTVQNRFISKVYGIVFCQLCLTACFSIVTYTVNTVQQFIISNPELLVVAMCGLLSSMITIFCYKITGHLGIFILTIFTICQSYIIGLVCTAYSPVALMSALTLTCVSTGCITVYVFINKDKDFRWVIPVIIGGSCSFIGLIFMTFLLGSTYFTSIALGVIGSMLFSFYLIWDTYYILSRYTKDDYILAAINIYLDIINMFLSLLQVTGRNK